ncbi:hypothetical protein EYF80_025005 [Liparis tanakae]|uniref:Uncharacterized protein n=1 Tax=Liparis tanakae TaxID=230148 RepID=A0A4Z2HGZ3_9TELE|nr:hypothetical protein EYF80_025005 [Liparis tanakae]
MCPNLKKNNSSIITVATCSIEPLRPDPVLWFPCLPPHPADLRPRCPLSSSGPGASQWCPLVVH